MKLVLHKQLQQTASHFCFFFTRMIIQYKKSRLQIVGFKFLTLPQLTMKTLNSSYSVSFKAYMRYVDLWQHFRCLTKIFSKSKSTEKPFFFCF